MDIQEDLLPKACLIIENNCPRSQGLGRKSRIPIDRSFREGIRNMNALVSTTGRVGLIFRSSAASSIPSRPDICRSVMTKSIRSGSSASSDNAQFVWLRLGLSRDWLEMRHWFDGRLRRLCSAWNYPCGSSIGYHQRGFALALAHKPPAVGLSRPRIV